MFHYKPSILGYPHIHHLYYYSTLVDSPAAWRVLDPFFFVAGSTPGWIQIVSAGLHSITVYGGPDCLLQLVWWLTDPSETYESQLG